MGAKRMPPLVTDEVILLIDTYFQLKGIEDISTKNELIDELSNNMKKLPFFHDLKEDKAFRSPEGMRMCLANVGFIDPDNSSKFGHGSALQKRVFEYYRDKKETLRKIAMAIVSLAQEHIVLDPICDSVNTQLSHVIKAIGVDEKYASGTIRISLSPDNSDDDVRAIANAIVKITTC